MRAGVAISPDTPSTAITDDVGNAADMLLVMTVYPGMALRCRYWLGGSYDRYQGRGGQKFLERCVPKVAELRARFPSKDIEVDGGVGPSTVDACTHAGEPLFYVKGVWFWEHISFLRIRRQQRHCRGNSHF